MSASGHQRPHAPQQTPSTFDHRTSEQNWRGDSKQKDRLAARRKNHCSRIALICGGTDFSPLLPISSLKSDGIQSMKARA
jgi:hypothetical protein